MREINDAGYMEYLTSISDKNSLGFAQRNQIMNKFKYVDAVILHKTNR